MIAKFNLVIHQLYAFPYLGLFQQFQKADCIIFNNTQYVKQSWINRNRLWDGEKIIYFTIPIEKCPTETLIDNVKVHSSWYEKKMWNKLRFIYCRGESKSRYDEVMEALFPRGPDYLHENLSVNNLVSIRGIFRYLGLRLPMVHNSDVFDIKELKGKDRVLKLCDYFKSICSSNITYINAPGGRELYDRKEFEQNNIDLRFFDCKLPDYGVPLGLSIIDVLMRNPKEKVQEWIQQGEIIK